MIDSQFFYHWKNFNGNILNLTSGPEPTKGYEFKWTYIQLLHFNDFLFYKYIWAFLHFFKFLFYQELVMSQKHTKNQHCFPLVVFIIESESKANLKENATKKKGTHY